MGPSDPFKYLNNKIWYEVAAERPPIDLLKTRRQSDLFFIDVTFAHKLFEMKFFPKVIVVFVIFGSVWLNSEQSGRFGPKLK